jgi:hypothetical protein
LGSEDSEALGISRKFVIQRRLEMEEEYSGRLFSRLRASYADKRNTITWALMIWTVSAVGFALFMPVPATLVRSIGVAVGWSMIHILRRM